MATGFGSAQGYGDSLALVVNQRSEYVIFHRPGAPESVVRAAEELQRVVRLATGVTLPVVTTRKRAPAIVVGEGGGDPAPGATDAFAITTQGRDLVIAGRDVPDSPDADPWSLPSEGTWCGTMEFLERFAGVRWLMPGELGEDAPALSELRVDLAQPIRGVPSFPVRDLLYVQEDVPDSPGHPTDQIRQWLAHQRLSTAWHRGLLTTWHSWSQYLTPADLQRHPEWAAQGVQSVRDGEVVGLCLTAPGLAETFAQRVVAWLDEHPEAAGASISPADGPVVCECPNCRRLRVTDPHGQRSVAPAVLDFYRRVAEIVGRARPDRRLGGYVYYNYQYPPVNPPVLPDNLYLCWAPLNYYGFGLFKPVYRDEFAGVLAQWAALSPHFAYANYSTWMRSLQGAPLPLGLDILRLELPAVARHHTWAVQMVGNGAWGVGGPGNYILARQMWDATADPARLRDEWLRRAYGPGWKYLRELFELVEARMKRRKLSEPATYRGDQYELNAAVLADVYAPLFPEMETLYHRAETRCATAAQRERLATFGENLVVLHHALRHAGLLPHATVSRFYRDDAAFVSFLRRGVHPFSLYQDRHRIQYGPISPAASTPDRIRLGP